MPTLAQITAVLDTWYPPTTAESWDAVGLTCGDPATEIDRVVLAVDCVPATVAEAVSAEAQLLITHHPLLLSAVHSVAATDPKGILVHRMVRAGLAHFVAHTNADVAARGVSEALADRVGLSGLRPLVADSARLLDQLTVYVPGESLEPLIAALSDAGAGALGNYDRCTFTVEGTGTYRPLPGADPTDGDVGVLRRKPEVRLSMVLPRSRREAVIAAMREVHPYEEVAFELTEQASVAASAGTGTGRIGELADPVTLSEFADRLARSLPQTVWGIRAAGDPDKRIRTVAVCGGSGGSYADLARASGADAYLTADLKHHATLEAVAEREGSPMALIDAAHWATEAPWLDVLAPLLSSEFGPGLDVRVSSLATDPWTLHAH